MIIVTIIVHNHNDNNSNDNENELNNIFRTIFFTRVGSPRNRFLIGSLTAALRLSKGWVRKDLNLVMGIGYTLLALV